MKFPLLDVDMQLIEDLYSQTKSVALMHHDPEATLIVITTLRCTTLQSVLVPVNIENCGLGSDASRGHVPCACNNVERRARSVE
jgi:hypothetical protein